MGEFAVAKGPTVLLASSSPRRAELLRTHEIEPIIAAVDIDESVRPMESAPDLVARLALEKARAGWKAWSSGQVLVRGSEPSSGWMVIAADTVVEVDGSILGKPEGTAEARRMLLMLSGSKHQVHTGVAVGLAGRIDSSLDPLWAVETTNVVMRTLDTDTIGWYVQTGEPLDKAGAYGIQGKGSVLVERIEGSFPNVVGLPISTVDRLCREFGWPLYRLAAGVSPVKVVR